MGLLGKHFRLLLLAGCLGLCWLGVALYAFTSSFGSVRGNQTAFALPMQYELYPFVRMSLTQGWGFFTKSPRDEEFFVFEKRGDAWTNAFSGPSAALHNALGLNRRMRAQGLEFGLLTHLAPDGAWAECDTMMILCFDRHVARDDLVTLYNPSTTPYYCGTIAFALQRPVPWAWQRLNRKIVMPSRIMVAEVVCDS